MTLFSVVGRKLKRIEPDKSVRKQTRVWKTRDGRKLRVCDMSDVHLVNTIRHLERLGAKRWKDAFEAASSVESMVSGDMASYYAEMQVDLVIESDFLEFVPEIYWCMLEDTRRRGLDVRIGCDD